MFGKQKFKLRAQSVGKSKRSFGRHKEWMINQDKKTLDKIREAKEESQEPDKF